MGAAQKHISTAAYMARISARAGNAGRNRIPEAEMNARREWARYRRPIPFSLSALLK